MKKKSRGRPKGSKNKKTLKKVKQAQPIPVPANVAVKRGRGRAKKTETVASSKFFESVEVSDNPEDVNAVLAKANKGGRGRPKGSKNTGEVEEIFKRVVVKENRNGWALRYPSFKSVPKQYRVDADTTARGIRVLVSSYPDFYKIYFKRYYMPGEGGYPHGGVEVFNGNNHRSESYRYDQVAVHPKGGSIRLIENVDGDVVVDQYVPVTGREERDARKMARREKKMAKANKKQYKVDIKNLKAEIKALNKSKNGLKPKARKTVRDQVKEKKNKILELKKEIENCTKLAKGEGTIVPL